MKTKEKVIEVIKENSRWEGEISLDLYLTQDLGLDSLDMLMIVNTLEDEYNIEVEQDCLKNLKTVADVIDVTDQLLLVKA